MIVVLVSLLLAAVVESSSATTAATATTIDCHQPQQQQQHTKSCQPRIIREERLKEDNSSLTTTTTSIPARSSQSTESSTSSNDTTGRLSIGAAVGIGVAVALIVTALLIAVVMRSKMVIKTAGVRKTKGTQQQMTQPVTKDRTASCQEDDSSSSSTCSSHHEVQVQRRGLDYQLSIDAQSEFTMEEGYTFNNGSQRSVGVATTAMEGFSIVSGFSNPSTMQQQNVDTISIDTTNNNNNEMSFLDSSTVNDDDHPAIYVVTRTVTLPPGRLGLRVEHTANGPTIVSVRPDSPCADHLFEGDVIVQLGDDPGHQLSVTKIAHWLGERRHQTQPQRTITVQSRMMAEQP